MSLKEDVTGDFPEQDSDLETEKWLPRELAEGDVCTPTERGSDIVEDCTQGTPMVRPRRVISEDTREVDCSEDSPSTDTPMLSLQA